MAVARARNRERSWRKTIACDEGGDGTETPGLTFEQGAYLDVWLVRWQGRPIGAVGYAEGDGRWRAAWQGNVVGSSYATRDEAARVLLERLQNAGDTA